MLYIMSREKKYDCAESKQCLVESVHTKLRDPLRMWSWTVNKSSRGSQHMHPWLDFRMPLSITVNNFFTKGTVLGPSSHYLARSVRAQLFSVWVKLCLLTKCLQLSWSKALCKLSYKSSATFCY